MKVWITKYALTGGIEEVEAETNFNIAEGFISEVNEDRRHLRNFHREGGDWHRTREGAEKRADAMRIAKIASLKNQIAKLEKLDFTAPAK